MSRDFNMTEKLAAACAIIAGIPFEHRKLMTAEQVLSLFNFDHDPLPHAKPFDGPNVHWNCTPRLIYGGSLAGMGHREKTAKHDVPQIARARRLSEKQEEFRRAMLAKNGEDISHLPPLKKKPKRKMQSRGFQGHRKFDGTPVWKGKQA
jgi:hypothetical protein